MPHSRPLFIPIPLAGRLRGVAEAQAYADAHSGALPVVRISPRRLVVPVGLLAKQAGVTVEEVWAALEVLEANDGPSSAYVESES